MRRSTIAAARFLRHSLQRATIRLMSRRRHLLYLPAAGDSDQMDNSNNDSNLRLRARIYFRPEDLPVTYVHSGLSAGLLPYTRGHAWQHGFLDQRLEHLRRKREEGQTVDGETISTKNDAGNLDRLLLFQHMPVYTLGRGADENNLVFLENEPDGGQEKRAKLSRTARGEQSARLTAANRIMLKSSITGGRLSIDHSSNVACGEFYHFPIPCQQALSTLMSC